MADIEPLRTSLPHDQHTVFVIRGDQSVLAEFSEEAALLGVIVSEWNAIEHNLSLLLSWSLRADAKIVFPMTYAVVSNRARLEVVFAALRQLLTGPGDVGELERIEKEAHNVLSNRNEFAHSLYMIADGKLVAGDMRKMLEGKPWNELQRKRMTECVAQTLALKQAINLFIGKMPWRRQV